MVPVRLRIAFTIGTSRNWLNVWKPSIDALDPLLGRTRAGRDWRPETGASPNSGYTVQSTQRLAMTSSSLSPPDRHQWLDAEIPQPSSRRQRFFLASTGCPCPNRAHAARGRPSDTASQQFRALPTLVRPAF